MTSGRTSVIGVVRGTGGAIWGLVFGAAMVSWSCGGGGPGEGPIGEAGAHNVPLGQGGEGGNGVLTGTAGTKAFGGSGGTGGRGVAGSKGSAGTGGSAGEGGMAGTGSGGASTGGEAGTPVTGGNDGGAVAGKGGSGAIGGGKGGSGGAGGTGGRAPMTAKFCGNITTRGQVRSDFAMYWNQITPENEGKWGSVERTQGQYNWTSLDAIYQFAKDNNIPFKQHNFVWGSQQPTWLSGLSAADQKAAVEAWIKAFCTRYPDTPLIDVVNEPPPHTTPVYMNALGGAGKSGYDWIAQAFTWAHQYCPNSILILNDYNNIETASDNSHTIAIVNAIKSVGAPINAVGAQAHAASGLPASTVQMYIDKIATMTGLPVYISEYDINQADDTKQSSIMQSQFTMFWNDANVKGITIWGYVEGATWESNSGLMSSSGQLRPAMTWLMQFLASKAK